MPTIRTDVLIVGAGPTGLVLALELLRHGVSPLLVEREPDPSPLSKAIVVHARTLEVLEACGASAALVAAGLPLRRVQMFAPDAREPLFAVPFTALPTAYPFLLSLPQARTEQLLTERLAALGGQVQRGVGLVGFTQDPDGVTAELTDGSTVRARWLVGCDGAHSVVRHGLGLEFRGAAYPLALVAGDVAWDADLPRDGLTSFLGDGFLACFPLPDGRWRLIATADDGVPDPPTFADLEAVVARAGPGGALSDPSWVGGFRIHARQVDAYRAGRVLLAGDAAHIHSPVGGQGLNTGIQDAHNLAWKLAAALRGAPDALVDSYEAERHPVASQVLAATDAMTRIGTARHPWVRAVRDPAAAALAGLALVRDRVTLAVSELDVAYRDSPIVLDRAPAARVHAGDRPPALPVDPRHQLLCVSGPDVTPDGRRRLRLCEAFARSVPSLAVAEAPDLFGLRQDAVLVVRPDGYVGARLSPADPERLAEWVEHTLGA